MFDGCFGNWLLWRHKCPAYGVGIDGDGWIAFGISCSIVGGEGVSGAIKPLKSACCQWDCGHKGGSRVQQAAVRHCSLGPVLPGAHPQGRFLLSLQQGVRIVTCGKAEGH